jgi:hypothetical protein
MPIDVDLTYDNPDPLLKLTDYTDLVALLRLISSASIASDLAVYVKSTATPSIDNQDRVWARLDGSGRPLGTYIFYGGRWVRETPPVSARFGFFTGDPTLYFDGDGRGLTGSGDVAADYYGWQIMNGNNGTPNLSNKFLILGAMDNDGITGFSSGWRTNVTGTPLGEGGEAEVTLDENTTYIPARNVVEAGKYTADGNTQGGSLWGDTNGSTDFNVIDADAGNDDPDPISIIPPFYALAMIQFIGYTY